VRGGRSRKARPIETFREFAATRYKRKEKRRRKEALRGLDQDLKSQFLRKGGGEVRLLGEKNVLHSQRQKKRIRGPSSWERGAPWLGKG